MRTFSLYVVPGGYAAVNSLAGDSIKSVLSLGMRHHDYGFLLEDEGSLKIQLKSGDVLDKANALARKKMPLALVGVELKEGDIGTENGTRLKNRVPEGVYLVGFADEIDPDFLSVLFGSPAYENVKIA